jgi:hypothetical protein
LGSLDSDRLTFSFFSVIFLLWENVCAYKLSFASVRATDSRRFHRFNLGLSPYARMGGMPIPQQGIFLVG